MTIAFILLTLALAWQTVAKWIYRSRYRRAAKERDDAFELMRGEIERVCEEWPEFLESAEK